MMVSKIGFGFIFYDSYFTPDTYANKHSAQAARLAAGLCADLASEIVSGRAKNGFALVWRITFLNTKIYFAVIIK